MTSARQQPIVIPPQIYAKRNIKKGSAYWKLDKYDLIDKVLPELASGLWVMNDGGVFERTIRKGVGYDTPWIHRKILTKKRCSLDHFIKFNYFGYIPPRCLKCFKVVVAPRTLLELQALRQIQWDMNVPSKCGVEVRNYVSRLYGGYFYTDSITEGQMRYKQVRQAVDQAIGPECPVLLKRGCTEMELGKGRSDEWFLPTDMQELDEYIDNRFDIGPYMYTTMTQADTVLLHTEKLWIEWAYAHGDPTYKNFTDDEPIWNPPQTYHDMELEDAKLKLIEGKAKAFQLNSEAARNIVTQLATVAEGAAVNKSIISQLSGYDKLDPMAVGDLIEMT